MLLVGVAGVCSGSTCGHASFHPWWGGPRRNLPLLLSCALGVNNVVVQAYEVVTHQPLERLNLSEVRGMDGIKEAQVGRNGARALERAMHAAVCSSDSDSSTTRPLACCPTPPPRTCNQALVAVRSLWCAEVHATAPALPLCSGRTQSGVAAGCPDSCMTHESWA